MSTDKTCNLMRKKTLVQGPYTYVANPGMAADFVVPSNVTIGEIRVATTGLVYIDTPRRTNELLRADGYDVFQVQVTRVRVTGTTGTGITLFGVYDDETYGVE